VSAEPGGCRHCGIPERQHYQQWTEAAGWHQWVQPEQSQILARMKARKAARANNSLKGSTPMSMPPALATIAALHTLLAEHPELAELPIRWSVEPDGDLHASPRYLADGSHAAVRALAVAVGGEPYEYQVTSDETDEAFVVVALSGSTLAGMTVHSYGYELLLFKETAAVGGTR
jgi:hypothetical protein